MKAEAVRVRRAAAGPVGQAAVDAAKRLQPSRPRRLRDDGPEVAGVQAARGGDRALFVGGETLDLPRRQKQIGKRIRQAAEDASNKAGPSLRPIEMDDVRELVREGQPQPVVGVADELPSGRATPR